MTTLNQFRYTCPISKPLELSGELPVVMRVATSQLVEDSVRMFREGQIRCEAETQSHGPRGQLKAIVNFGEAELPKGARIFY